jgi:actin
VTANDDWMFEDIFYFGDEARQKRGILKLKHPMKHGVVTNWDDMERIWRHAFDSELRVDPSDHPVLLTDAPLNPKSHRERMLETMFETFHVPSFYVKISGELALYAAGCTTGIVLDIGDTVTQIVPSYESLSVWHGIGRVELGGRDLTDWLWRNLAEPVYDFSTSAQREILNDIKEQCGYVALDFASESQRASRSRDFETSWTLPDGSQMVIGEERFICPELLFKPRSDGFDFEGIDQALFDAITRCDRDLHNDLYSSIVLAGGGTMFNGLRERLQKEMARRAPPKVKVNVIAPPERMYAAWIGGSILASLATFPEMAITHEEYYDEGRGILRRIRF